MREGHTVGVGTHYHFPFAIFGASTSRPEAQINVVVMGRDYRKHLQLCRSST